MYKDLRIQYIAMYKFVELVNTTSIKLLRNLRVYVCPAFKCYMVINLHFCSLKQSVCLYYSFHCLSEACLSTHFVFFKAGFWTSS